MRDKNGRFVKNDPESKSQGSKGGKIGGKAKVKTKGFGSNPALASKVIKEYWDKRHENQD